jgi:hypothetical protein
MRLSLLVHILIAGILAASTAIGCRLLFLIPFWLGGILGDLIYTAFLLEFRLKIGSTKDISILLQYDFHHYHHEAGRQ